MSDKGINQKGRRRPPSQGSMWDDVWNRRIAFLMAIIIVGALLSVISILLSGIIQINPGPQNAQQANVARQENLIDKNQTEDQWASLIVSYLQAGRIEDARRALEAAQESGTEETHEFHLHYAEAQILMSEGRLDEATVKLLEVMELTQEAYDEEFERGMAGGDQSWIAAQGMPHNHWLAGLDLIRIYRGQSEYEKALELLDGFLEYSEYNAGVMIDRASVRLELGDVEGAIEDYTQALKFLPDDEEALEGLSRAEAMTP